MLFDGDLIENILIVEDSNITVADIYNKLTKLDMKKIKFPFILLEEKNITITLQKIKQEIYMFILDNKTNEKKYVFELINNPLKIYEEGKTKKEIIDIVNPQQLENIQKKYSNHQFYCESLGKYEIFAEIIYGKIITHISCNKKHFIKKINKINMEENTFNSYFDKDETKTDFQTVYDFESNYDEYFKDHKYIIDKKAYLYKLYELNGQKRKELINNFKYIIYKERPYLFYGNPGMGKSISLIYALKYACEHDYIGTFYIHCKMLYNLIQSDIKKVKKILKEEIVYLFKNEYIQYIKCCEEIDKYLINRKSTFWDLIKIVEKSLTYNEKTYLFAFDQYNEENIDPQNKEIKALLSRNSVNLKILALCSMDDKEIKNYKINRFLNFKSSENIFITEEIVDLIDVKNMKIDNNSIYDDTLEKIGKTIKNYNILKYIHDNQNKKVLDNYVDELRKNIKDYLIKFYGLDKKHNFNFLSWWTNTFYEISKLNEIKDFISFKYFDIKKNPKKENEFEIIYLYPIVEEVMVEIFSQIFYQNVELKNIVNVLDIDGGAKGYVFEKYIVHKMKPINEESLVFQYFKIDKVIKCDKFVPKINENWNNFYFKESFEDGIYLFEQRIFGGKAFDAAIIKLINKEAIAFLFQISLKKPYKDIFTLFILKKNINDFAKYFSIVYNIRFDKIYFTYIFDYENVSDMEVLCQIRKMPFIFFNIKNEKFVDKNNVEIRLNDSNIRNYFINPVKFGFSFDDFQRCKLVGLLNTAQEESINKFIKNEKFFEIKKNVKVFIDRTQETIISIMKNGKQKKRIFLLKLSSEEAEDYYYSIYTRDKSFAVKNKNSFGYDCLLLAYINNEKNAVCHIVLDNGNIHKLDFTPGNLLYKNDFYCYEICEYSN